MIEKNIIVSYIELLTQTLGKPLNGQAHEILFKITTYLKQRSNEYNVRKLYG